MLTVDKHLTSSVSSAAIREWENQDTEVSLTRFHSKCRTSLFTCTTTLCLASGLSYLHSVIVVVDNADDTARWGFPTPAWGRCLVTDGSLPTETRYRWRSTLPSATNPASGPCDAAAPATPAASGSRSCVPGIVLLPVAGRLLKKKKENSCWFLYFYGSYIFL